MSNTDLNAPKAPSKLAVYFEKVIRSHKAQRRAAKVNGVIYTAFIIVAFCFYPIWFPYAPDLHWSHWQSVIQLAAALNFGLFSLLRVGDREIAIIDEKISEIDRLSSGKLKYKNQRAGLVGVRKWYRDQIGLDSIGGVAAIIMTFFLMIYSSATDAKMNIGHVLLVCALMLLAPLAQLSGLTTRYYVRKDMVKFGLPIESIK